LTRLHRRIDSAERSYYRALKQLCQLQSDLPAPAAAKAAPPGPPPPSVRELPPAAPIPDELEPAANQPPSHGIGFVPPACAPRRAKPSGLPPAPDAGQMPSGRAEGLTPPSRRTPVGFVPKPPSVDYLIQSTVSPHGSSWGHSGALA
jgi:hypothetical protein